VVAHPPDTAVYRPRILLVEDDAALLRALAFSLRIEGFDVTPLDRAEALLEQAFDRPVLIVTDQNLPGLTGLEAIATLRERGVTAPAVLISAEPPRGFGKERARELGVTVVEKPILGDRLIAVLRTLSAIVPK
jgi:DNA-binding response OmpR family regulator